MNKMEQMKNLIQEYGDIRLSEIIKIEESRFKPKCYVCKGKGYIEVDYSPFPKFGEYAGPFVIEKSKLSCNYCDGEGVING